MHQQIAELPTSIESPDASMQRLPNFGEIDGGGLDVVRGTMTANVDITSLLEGLEDDCCQVPHWGYVVDGASYVRYADGIEDLNEVGEAVYWPPKHTFYQGRERRTGLIQPARRAWSGLRPPPKKDERDGGGLMW